MITKKKALLLFLLNSLVVYSSQFSFTNEMKINDETNYRPDGRIKNEWTIGRGYYKISEKLKFIFDVDRDFVRYDDSDDNYNGWDTYGGLEYEFSDKEIFGKKVENSGRLDFYWDNTTVKEREVGFSFKSKIILDSKSNLTLKGIARNVAKKSSSSDYDVDDNIYGIESWYYNRLNDNWSFSASLKGYWGGYYDGGSTFYSTDRDGFNHEGYAVFNYCKDLYEINSYAFAFETDFAHYWYGQGEDYKGTSSRYTKSYIRPGIVVEKKISDYLKVYLNTRYNVIGEYAFDNNKTRGVDEWETIFGFNVRY